ncbi:hypothetical protein SDC9_47820 [bioreactor metagenome]|uniref:Uncharacterized protein n=1 Tax=bioreactor metagenome TaxID=1076179 RepID=A0A644WCQ3_9ZZZZ
MEFNITRFWNLLKREVILNKKSYLYIIFGFFVAGFIFLGDLEWHSNIAKIDPSYHSGFNSNYLLWFAIILSGFMYQSMKYKSLMINEIILPSSIFEKYLVSFFRVIIFTPILSFIGIILFFLLTKYAFGSTFVFISNELSLGFLFESLFYAYFYALPFISVLHFSSQFKNRFIPMLAVIIITIFTNLWGYIDRLIGKANYGDKIDNFMPYYGTSGFYLWATIIGIIIFLFFQYITYLRYTEREV